MANLRSRIESRLPDDWNHPLARSRRKARREADTNKLLIAGVVTIGVGLLAWHYFGAELRRYIKIHNM